MSLVSPGLVLLISLSVITPGQAASGCPGNPNALGTSRTLVVDPLAHPLIGTMQYAETLPLADKEVVLTFDDGPLPRHSNAILDILAAQCIKATFFVVGIMATDYPQGVRRLRAEGHTIGTHTQHHPLGMKRMDAAAAQAEIDGGIAATTAALGGEAPAPFFRIPGLSRAEATEDYANARGLQVWSADFPADDWRHISAATVHRLAMSRIAAKGKGVLLLHDIQSRTVEALPAILRDLKANGYRIVHVVPAREGLPATPTDPQQWQLHPAVVASSTPWPAVPGFVFARSETLPIPAMSESELTDGTLMLLPEPFDRAGHLARDTTWPITMGSSHQPSFVAAASAMLPVPDVTMFKLVDRLQRPVTTVAEKLESRRVATSAPVTATRPREVSAIRRAIPGSVPVMRPGFDR